MSKRTLSTDLSTIESVIVPSTIIVEPHPVLVDPEEKYSVGFFTPNHWPKDEATFLELLDVVLQKIQVDDNDLHDIVKAFETLCIRYASDRNHEGWERLFRKIQECCQSGWMHVPTIDITTQSEWYSRCQKLWHAVFPSILPFRLHIEQCSNTENLEKEIKTWSAPRKSLIQAIIEKSFIECYLLYMVREEGVEIHFGRIGDKPLKWESNDNKRLLTSISLTTTMPDELIDEVLRLAYIADLLDQHPQLNKEILRAFLRQLPAKTHFLVLQEPQSIQLPLRIISQQQSLGACYYGEWFSIPTAEQTSTPCKSLPGDWVVAYPQTEQGKILNNPRCEGWISLDAKRHMPLVSCLNEYEALHRRFDRYQFASRLHQQCERLIKHGLSSTRFLWYRLSAELAAEQQCWFPHVLSPSPSRTYAIIQANFALAELKIGSEIKKENKIWMSTMNDWVHTATRDVMRRLLPMQQARLQEALQPFKRKTGQLSLADFKQAHHVFDQLVTRYLWVEPTKVQATYAEFNKACLDRRSDIVSQMRDTRSQSSLVWKNEVQTLLDRWQRDGYEDLTKNWNVNSQAPYLPILAILQDGLAELTYQGPSSSIPTAWKKAHQQWLQQATHLALQGRQSALDTFNQRYAARLRCYRVLCSQLNLRDPGIWCDQQIEALQNLNPLSLIKTGMFFPLQWSWHDARQRFLSENMFDEQESKQEQWDIIQSTIHSPLQKMCKEMLDHIQNQLGDPPCVFEVVGMISPASTQSGRMHLLIESTAHLDDPYWEVLLQMMQIYCALLPKSLTIPSIWMTEINSWASKSETPDNLAQTYCPLWTPELQEDSLCLDQVELYLPVFHYHNANGVQSRLMGSFLTHINNRLQHISDAAKNAEQNIRKRHHALFTEVLLPLESPSTEIKDRLEERLKAQREIRKLRSVLQKRYAPIVESLCFMALMADQIMQCSISWEEQSSSELEMDEEKKGGKQSQIGSMPTYLRLYQLLPRLWKPVFMEQLIKWQQSHISTFKNLSAQLITELTDEADRAGWCYREERHLLQWQQNIRELLTTEPSLHPFTEEKRDELGYPPIIVRFIENGELYHGRLKSAVVEQLLDLSRPETDPWKPKDPASGGRHHLLRVHPRVDLVFWFKFCPEQAGTQHLVQRLGWRLGDWNTVPQQLLSIQVGTQPPIPVLITQEAAIPSTDAKSDAHFNQVLKHRPQELTQLSPRAFVSTFIRTLVFNFEDDKSEDFFWVLEKNDNDEPGEYYRLLRIDDERAFFSPERISSSWLGRRELNVKTIVYFLDQMNESWRDLEKRDHRVAVYRNFLKKLVPIQWLQDILQDISDLHDQWCQLFSSHQVIEIAQSAIFRGEVVLPVMMVVPDCSRALLERLFLIKEALQHSDVTSSLILDSVQPGLSLLYQQWFSLAKNPLSRFDQGPGKLYLHDNQGRAHTTLSPLTALSLQLNKEIKSGQEKIFVGQVVKQVWCRQRYSVTQAYAEIVSWHQEKLLEIEYGLLVLEGDPVRRNSKHHSELKENKAIDKTNADHLHKIAEEQFKLLPIGERTKLLERLSRKYNTLIEEDKRHKQRAEAILNLLSHVSVTQLSLTVYAKFLNKEGLLKILRCAGRHLLHLDISGCIALSSKDMKKIMETLSDFCPNLRSLKAKDLTCEKMIIQTLPQCYEIDLTHCAHLKDLILRQLDRLNRLNLTDCISLESLGPWQLPSISRLYLENCAALKELRLKVKNPEKIKVKTKGCSLISGDICSLEGKEFSPSNQILKQFAVARSAGSSRLDLSGCRLEPAALEWLNRLMPLNPLLTHLNLSENAACGTVGANALAKILRISSLKSLKLSCMKSPAASKDYIFTPELPISDSEVTILAPALKENSSLTELDLEENQIGDLGAKQLADVLMHNRSLRLLNLARNPMITTEGADALAKSLEQKNNCLCELKLSKKGISKEIITDLDSYLQRNRQLQDHLFVMTEEKFEITPMTEALKEKKYLVQEVNIETKQLEQPVKDVDHHDLQPFVEIKLDEIKSDVQLLDTKTIIHKPEQVRNDNVTQESPLSMLTEEDSIEGVQWMRLLQPLVESKHESTLLPADLPEEMSILSPSTVLNPYRDLLRMSQGSVQDSELSLEVSKYLCWMLQSKSRVLQIDRDIASIALPSAERKLDDYIRSHIALKEYHDELLDTLEFGFTAAKLGITGRLQRTNTVGSALSMTGPILDGLHSLVGKTVPGVGIVTGGLGIINKIKMLEEDYKISEWFTGGMDDIKMKSAKLARERTFIIREELLLAKNLIPRTSGVLSRLKEISWKDLPEGIKGWLNQIKAQLFRRGQLSYAQKKAIYDAGYLLDQLPKKNLEKEISGCIRQWLKILMHDDDFEFDAKTIEKDLQINQDSKNDMFTLSADTSHGTIQFYLTQWYKSLSEIRRYAQQPVSSNDPDHWQIFRGALEKLEEAELRLAKNSPWQDVVFHQWLTSWFESLHSRELPRTTGPVSVIESGQSFLMSSSESLATTMSSSRSSVTTMSSSESSVATMSSSTLVSPKS